MDLSAFEANYQPFQFKQENEKPKAGAAKQLAASLLPTVGGALGAVAGSFVAPVAGTAAGGAGGAALGEALRQRILGEDFSAKKLATEGALGAVPGVFKGAKAGVQAVKSGKAAEAAKSVLTQEGRIAKTRADVIANGKKVAGINNDTSVATLRDSSDAMRQAAKRENSFEPLNPLNMTEVRVNPNAAASFKEMGDEGLKRLAPVAESATTKPTLLSKFSSNATKRASGIKTDPSVGGIDRADEAAQTFQRLKITGTPEQQLRKIGETMTNHSKQVDDILAKNPIALDGAAVKAQVQKAIEDPLKYAELDLTTPGAQRALNAHLDKFAGAKTAKEVNDYVKVINKIAVKAQGKIDRGATLTDKESAALAAKKAGDEVLSQYPEIAPLKKDMAVLFERNGDVTKRSTKTAGIPLLGVKSNAVAQGASAVASKAGQVASKADAALQSTTANNAKTVGKSLFNQFATRAVASPLLSEDQPENVPINQSNPAMISDTTNMPISSDSMSQLNTNSLNDANQIDYEAEARNALSKGDYKAFDAIMSLAALAEKKATSGANKPLSAEASKVIANVNSGLDSLSELEGMLNNDPSVLQKTAIPGRAALGGALGNIVGTASYDTAARNVADVITRLRTGAALTDAEEKFYKSQLPQAFDSPEVVQQKLSMFRNLFGSVANRTGSAGTDTQALVGAQ